MELNPAQQQAVEHVEGPLLILAGPGSGKTRVLVHRIARLIETGAAYPSQILAVTFTNKAADEMRRRTEALVGPRAREISMGTFHSVCLRILRGNAEAAGLSERFVVYDDADQLALIKECLADLDIDKDRLPPRSALERISRAKDACQGPEEFAAAVADNPYLERVSRIYTRYQRRLAELQAADFGDLIRLVVKLLDSDSRLREALQRRWRFMLVDEYQDTNRAQYKLLAHIASAHRNICVVGDDDQSVYRWRGADIENILRFEHDFHGAAVVRLEQNYRSTGAIVAAASAVVAGNAGRKPKEIWTAREKGRRVSILSCESERREAEAVAARISAAVQRGRKLRDFAVFYRTNAQSRPLEEVFRRQGLQYRIYGGIRFYERAEVKDVLAYLRLLLDRSDDIALLRVINVPARGLGKTTVDRLKSFAAERSLSVFEAITPFVESGGARGAQSKQLIEFRDAIQTIGYNGMDRPLPAILHEVLTRTGYVEALAKESTIESEARLENINELVAAVEEFMPAADTAAGMSSVASREKASPPLAQFLDQVALVSDADAVDETQGAITMMTLHIAKGLEFPCVFMVGMEEGLFPHARSLDDPDELEEERRLCYVGMTRAMDELSLAHAFRRSIFGSERYNVASRFLDELPAEHVDRESSFVVSRSSIVKPVFKIHEPRTTNDERRTTDFEFDQRPPEEQASPLAKGCRVHHPQFGPGVITSCERTSAGHKVAVRFQDGEVKKLIAEFAGLTPA